MDLLLPGLGLFVWTLIAFLAVFFILRKFAWGPILNALNQRETNIADSIAAAERMKKEMGAQQAENERLLAEAREERSRLLKEAKEAKEKMINDAKDAAKVEANKIMEEARLQIEQKKNAALTDVKNQIGKLSLEVAEKILRKELSAADAQNNYAKQLAEEINLN